jgi:hypothetical protein
VSTVTLIVAAIGTAIMIVVTGTVAVSGTTPATGADRLVDRHFFRSVLAESRDEPIKGTERETLMFWWFQREDKFIRYEARKCANDVYELVELMPDGTERVERFTDETALKDRELALVRELGAC